MTDGADVQMPDVRLFSAQQRSPASTLCVFLVDFLLLMLRPRLQLETTSRPAASCRFVVLFVRILLLCRLWPVFLGLLLNTAAVASGGTATTGS